MKVRVYNGPEEDSADDSFWFDSTVLEVESFDPHLIAKAMHEANWIMPAGRLFFAVPEHAAPTGLTRGGFLFRIEETVVAISVVTD